MVWWESIDSIAKSLESSGEFQFFHLITTIILAGATIVLVVVIYLQVRIHNRELELAYLPYIMPRQHTDGTNFAFVTIENMANGAAKNVRVRVENLRTHHVLHFNPLGMKPQQTITIPINIRMRGLVGDMIQLDVHYEDVRGELHDYSDTYEIPTLFTLDT